MADDSEPGDKPKGRPRGRTGDKLDGIPYPALKHVRQTRRLARIDVHSGAGRISHEMKRAIVEDLGGRDEMSRIKLELIEIFTNAVVTMRYMNAQIAQGEIADVDINSYVQLANVALRYGSRLGLEREKRPDLKPDLDTFLALRKHKKYMDAKDLDEITEPEVKVNEEIESEVE